jgi:hypothetical protein
VRVFAVEMVYVPEGEFNVAKNFYFIPLGCCGSYSFNGSFNAPGSNFPVINTKLTPTLTYSDGTSASVRIKGDAGIDTNNDGVIDNTTYPIGYRAFYAYKYELSEQQYADFLNTLTNTQITTLGAAGTGITLTSGQYFSSTPNKACGNSNDARFFAYADWSGLRPMTVLEMNKASYGPLQPVYRDNTIWCAYGATLYSYPAWGGASAVSGACPTSLPGNPGQAVLQNVGYNASGSSDRVSSGASYYGIMDLTWNANEPVVRLSSFSFNSTNGNGEILSTGTTDVSTWNSSSIFYWEQAYRQYGGQNYGFRYVRSAE